MKKCIALLLALLTLLGATLLSTGCSTTDSEVEEREDISVACAKGLMSAVSIKAAFKSRLGSYLSSGSGVIYRLDNGEAYIITNRHVVASGGEVSEDIALFLYGRESEGEAIRAEYVGGSAELDIAVLRASAKAFRGSTVREAAIGDSDTAAVGDTAIAIGNPEGAGISATLGIISVVSEYISVTDASGKSTVSRVMRVDTAVNSGNSGGGLYDSRGRLVGIVNAKIIDNAVENIGYAIPVSVASAVADNILENEAKNRGRTPTRAMLGITLTESEATVSESSDGTLSISGRVAVASVKHGSVADGILSTGDEIIAASLKDTELSVTRRHHLTDLLLRASAGDTLRLSVRRRGKNLTVSIKITEASLVPL